MVMEMRGGRIGDGDRGEGEGRNRSATPAQNPAPGEILHVHQTLFPRIKIRTSNSQNASFHNFSGLLL
jgi:hypothetical protein